MASASGILEVDYRTLRLSDRAVRVRGRLAGRPPDRRQINPMPATAIPPIIEKNVSSKIEIPMNST